MIIHTHRRMYMEHFSTMVNGWFGLVPRLVKLSVIALALWLMRPGQTAFKSCAKVLHRLYIGFALWMGDKKVSSVGIGNNLSLWFLLLLIFFVSKRHYKYSKATNRVVWKLVKTFKFKIFLEYGIYMKRQITESLIYLASCGLTG